MRAAPRALLAASLTAVLVLAGCGDGGDGGAAGASGGAVLVVSMTEFAYDPDPIVVPPDGKILVVNDGAVAHDLVIPALGKGTIELRPGDRMELDLSDQPPGTYRVVCALPGHLQAGMETQITIGG